MIWGAKAVKRISKRNLGRQMFWFENSLRSETKNESLRPKCAALPKQ